MTKDTTVKISPVSKHWGKVVIAFVLLLVAIFAGLVAFRNINLAIALRRLPEGHPGRGAYRHLPEGHPDRYQTNNISGTMAGVFQYLGVVIACLAIIIYLIVCMVKKGSNKTTPVVLILGAFVALGFIVTASLFGRAPLAEIGAMIEHYEWRLAFTRCQLYGCLEGCIHVCRPYLCGAQLCPPTWVYNINFNGVYYEGGYVYICSHAPGYGLIVNRENLYVQYQNLRASYQALTADYQNLRAAYEAATLAGAPEAQLAGMRAGLEGMSGGLANMRPGLAGMRAGLDGMAQGITNATTGLYYGLPAAIARERMNHNSRFGLAIVFMFGACILPMLIGMIKLFTNQDKERLAKEAAKENVVE